MPNKANELVERVGQLESRVRALEVMGVEVDGLVWEFGGLAELYRETGGFVSYDRSVLSSF